MTEPRTMYDATNPLAVVDATLAAGYVDGNWPSYDAIKAKLGPDATVVSITVTGQNPAQVADVESGDLSPYSAAVWAASELSRGRRPTLYCSLFTVAQVVQALTRESVHESQVDWWIADWTGQAHSVPGAVAVQYAHSVHLDGAPAGALVDVSAVYTDWPATTPTPPIPEPNPPEVITVAVALPLLAEGTNCQATGHVQELLNAHRITTAVDNLFGPQTRANVEEFQRQAGGAVDGIVGAWTWATLLTT